MSNMFQTAGEPMVTDHAEKEQCETSPGDTHDKVEQEEQEDNNNNHIVVDDTVEYLAGSVETFSNSSCSEVSNVVQTTTGRSMKRGAVSPGFFEDVASDFSSESKVRCKAPRKDLFGRLSTVPYARYGKWVVQTTAAEAKSKLHETTCGKVLHILDGSRLPGLESQIPMKIFDIDDACQQFEELMELEPYSGNVKLSFRVEVT